MKKIFLTIFAILSFSTAAHHHGSVAPSTAVVKPYIQSSSQIYFGESKPEMSCGVEGRLLTTKEISEQIGHRKLCDQVTSEWAIWKILNSKDGQEWSFMGRGYSCEMKPGVNPWAQSLCVMNEKPTPNTVFVFPRSDYRGEHAWDGQAQIHRIGDEVTYARVASFRLGDGIQLVGYPGANFTGTPTIYTSDVQRLNHPIQSYKIHAIQTESDITFDFSSNTSYKVCLSMRASSGSNQLVEACSTDIGPKEHVLTQKQEMESTIVIAVYLKRFTSSGIIEEQGALYIQFTGHGDFNILHLNLLPKGIALTKSGDHISFVYQ